MGDDAVGELGLARPGACLARAGCELVANRVAALRLQRVAIDGGLLEHPAPFGHRAREGFPARLQEMPPGQFNFIDRDSPVVSALAYLVTKFVVHEYAPPIQGPEKCQTEYESLFAGGFCALGFSYEI